MLFMALVAWKSVVSINRKLVMGRLISMVVLYLLQTEASNFLYLIIILEISRIRIIFDFCLLEFFKKTLQCYQK